MTTSDTYDNLRRAVVDALGGRPTPERRRQVAADLRALAEQQERMAAKAEAQGGAPEAHSRGASERQSVAGMYIRIRYESDPQTGARRRRLLLGKQIWFELGGPERIDIQRVDAEIWIVAAKGQGGFLINTDVGLPAAIVPDGGPLDRLTPGRYAAAMRVGALVVGARVA